MNVSEILDGAADLIERDGWLQLGGNGQMLGRYPRCAAIAIHDVIGKVSHSTAHSALAIAVSGHDFAECIFHWNDAPERTAAEVVATLRACAVVERARTAVAVEREEVSA